MTDYQKAAIVAIEAQQAKVKEYSYQWMTGEQLKDICRMEPHSAELIAQDLANKSMSITEAEKKIAGFARKHGGCVPGIESDRILREFYGLPAAGGPVPDPEPETETERKEDKVLHLEDFF